ncbi:Uncharacterised protein [Streptococcus criceti]|uniref:Uncharacterized protein n=1 Tax=Streptococcus criceti HS-6 TaxID=873449 RepID=G5JR81_STRCG|nr:hypothetical protein STRCR_1967 [Streptococcus criceti HS-6]SUN42948.1 Uncharacterised protein [Streptococcus criceti]
MSVGTLLSFCNVVTFEEDETKVLSLIYLLGAVVDWISLSFAMHVIAAILTNCAEVEQRNQIL